MIAFLNIDRWHLTSHWPNTATWINTFFSKDYPSLLISYLLDILYHFKKFLNIKYCVYRMQEHGELK